MDQNHYVGVILVHNDLLVFQHRDDDPNIANPGTYGYFGGRVETEDATSLDAAVREMAEETDLGLTHQDFTFFKQYTQMKDEGVIIKQVDMYVCHIKHTDFALYEGQGIMVINPNELHAYTSKMTDGTLLVLKDYLEKKG